jgi:hypothetical protein
MSFSENDDLNFNLETEYLMFPQAFGTCIPKGAAIVCIFQRAKDRSNPRVHSTYFKLIGTSILGGTNAFKTFWLLG